jgi:The ARF-like 2 binding protein BART
MIHISCIDQRNRPDMFFDACEKGRNGRDINRTVFERMLAMDDFQTFKKIMVKRNMELQLEAIRALKAIRSQGSGSPYSSANYSSPPRGRDAGGFSMSEDFEMEAALKMSADLSGSPLPKPEELKEMMDAEMAEIMKSQGSKNLHALIVICCGVECVY